jgi:hypothetical protein
MRQGEKGIEIKCDGFKITYKNIYIINHEASGVLKRVAIKDLRFDFTSWTPSA